MTTHAPLLLKDADAATNSLGLQQRAAPEPQETPAAAWDAPAAQRQEVPAARPDGDQALRGPPRVLTAPVPQGALWHILTGGWLPSLTPAWLFIHVPAGSKRYVGVPAAVLLISTVLVLLHSWYYEICVKIIANCAIQL